VIISIADVKNHLKNGVTRYTDDTSYRPEIGSIMEKYNLTKTEVGQLFQDERLKGLRVHSVKEPAFVIAEDMDNSTEEETNDAPDEPEPEMEETPEPALEVEGISLADTSEEGILSAIGGSNVTTESLGSMTTEEIVNAIERDEL
jgi:hypothetical protein